MVNWFDLMRQAQGGHGLENFARQFGLSSQQTDAAIAALMPAFAMGLQRAATDPGAMAQLFRLMSGGHFPTFWDSPGRAFTPQARQEGKELLDQLFGSDEVSRRVAHQAAAFSGVGVDVLQQMLPLVAGIVAGGFAKLAASQGAVLSSLAGSAGGPASSGQTGAGAWADLWSQWMGAAPRPEPKPEPAPEPKSEAPRNPFEEMMASFLRVSATPGPEPKKQPEHHAEAPPPSEAKPQPERPAPQAQDPLQAWGEMMEKGQEMQRQHLEALQSIFGGARDRGPGGSGS